jgi:hypothetical protein
MVDLALMRGNIGRPSVGIFPVRGHSTVQGQRAVGITEKPGMVPAERIKSLFGIEVPQSKGVNTVEACEKIIDGSVRAMAKSIPVRVSPEPRILRTVGVRGMLRASGPPGQQAVPREVKSISFAPRIWNGVPHAFGRRTRLLWWQSELKSGSL